MASIGSVLGSVRLTRPRPPVTRPRNALTAPARWRNESTFLQLLVAEIKNQDPTQPMDSTTFLSQLAQFSQLEQMVGIRQDIETGTAPTGSRPAGSHCGHDPVNPSRRTVRLIHKGGKIHVIVFHTAFRLARQ